MEQRIEIYEGNRKRGSSFEDARSKSASLADEGWFVHDTCATVRVLRNGGVWEAVMVTYRRDVKTPVTPYESPSTHEAQPALRIVVCPHCDKQIRVTHESNVLVNCPTCNQQLKTP